MLKLEHNLQMVQCFLNMLVSKQLGFINGFEVPGRSRNLRGGLWEESYPDIMSKRLLGADLRSESQRVHFANKEIAQVPFKRKLGI